MKLAAQWQGIWLAERLPASQELTLRHQLVSLSCWRNCLSLQQQHLCRSCPEGNRNVSNLLYKHWDFRLIDVDHLLRDVTKRTRALSQQTSQQVSFAVKTSFVWTLGYLMRSYHQNNSTIAGHMKGKSCKERQSGIVPYINKHDNNSGQRQTGHFVPMFYATYGHFINCIRATCPTNFIPSFSP